MTENQEINICKSYSTGEVVKGVIEMSNERQAN